jgi:hypothetical protein
MFQTGLRVFGWMLLGRGFEDNGHVPDTVTFNIMIQLCQRAGLLPFNSLEAAAAAHDEVQQ